MRANELYIADLGNCRKFGISNNTEGRLRDYARGVSEGKFIKVEIVERYIFESRARSLWVESLARIKFYKFRYKVKRSGPGINSAEYTKVSAARLVEFFGSFDGEPVQYVNMFRRYVEAVPIAPLTWREDFYNRLKS